MAKVTDAVPAARQLNFDNMGMFTAAVLEQSEVWVDRAGAVRRLEELSQDHLANLEPFLLRKGDTLRIKWLLAKSRDHYATTGLDALGQECLLFSDNDGNLDRAFDQWIDHEMDRPLAEWLAERPLVKRIHELLETATIDLLETNVDPMSMTAGQS